MSKKSTKKPKLFKQKMRTYKSILNDVRRSKAPVIQPAHPFEQAWEIGTRGKRFGLDAEVPACIITACPDSQLTLGDKIFAKVLGERHGTHYEVARAFLRQAGSPPNENWLSGVIAGMEIMRQASVYAYQAATTPGRSKS